MATSSLLKVRNVTDPQMVSRELKAIETYVNNMQRPLYKAGRWYPAGTGLVGGGAAAGANSIRAYPFQLTMAVTISDLAASVITLHAGNNFQLAIYANDPVNFLPTTGSELAKTGNMATDTVAVVTADIVGANVTLQPGIYWALVNNSGGTAAFTPMPANNVTTVALVGGAAATNVFGGGAIVNAMYSTPVAFGTWGNLSAAVWTQITANSTALVAFKVA